MESAADQVHDSAGLEWAIRLGFVGYGVVHLLVGLIAVRLAWGDAGGDDASSEGALVMLASQPFGQLLVWVTGLGLALLVLWRGLEAWVGHDEEEGAKLWAKRGVSLAKAVLYGALAYSAIQVASSDRGSGSGSGDGGNGGGGGSTEQTITQRILELPGGQVLVALVGVGIIAYGGFLVYRGWEQKFLKHLDANGRSGSTGTAYEKLGQVGYIAKGVAVGVIGLLFGYAGVTHDSRESGGMDQALREIVQQPFGPFLLTAVGLGIACYGLFAFARARHLDR